MPQLFPEYDQFDALGLADLVRKKEVGAEELLDTALAIAAEVDPQIRALCHLNENVARESLSAGLPDGPFTGVPFLLKDITASAAGFSSSLGSRFFANTPQTADTELVRRLRAAGLVFFGRTTTPELAFSPTTEAVAYGAPTRNPWDLTRSPAGSSGGSGAAIAAGIVPMAHGTDGGGSIRQPAAANGLVGLKVTRARLPVGPFVGEGWAGLLSEGVLSRSVRDTAAFLDATQGADPGAPYVAPPPPMKYLDAIRRPPERLRMALLPHRFDGAAMTPEIEAAVRNVGALCQDLGHTVEEACPPVDFRKMMQAYVTIVCCGTALSIDERAQVLGRPPREDELEPLIWSAYERGKATSGPDYLAAITTGHRVGRAVAEFFSQYDVLITPVFSRLTAKIGEFAGTERDVLKFRLGENGAADYSPFMVLANVTGQPAISLPLVWSGSAPSIPIGTQFIGRFGEDHVLLALAQQLSDARPWFNRRPPLAVSADTLASWSRDA